MKKGGVLYYTKITFRSCPIPRWWRILQVGSSVSTEVLYVPVLFVEEELDYLSREDGYQKLATNTRFYSIWTKSSTRFSDHQLRIQGELISVRFQ